MTPTHLRVAKAILKLTNQDIERMTGIHRNTLLRAEAGYFSEKTIMRLRAFYAELGVEFIEVNDHTKTGVLFPQDSSGVRLPSRAARTKSTS